MVEYVGFMDTVVWVHAHGCLCFVCGMLMTVRDSIESRQHI